IPESDGRRIQIGWFQTETRGMSFNQSMTIPLELKLVSTADGPRMTFTPVKELESLRGKTSTLQPMTLKPGDRNPLGDVDAELLELRTEIDPGDASEIVLKVRDAVIIYEPQQQELSVNGHRAAAPLREGKLRLTIYCDRTGLEVFSADGLCYMPMPFISKPENRQISLETRGGSVGVQMLQVHELQSAWNTK
ncbi:MAG: hypothetical protein RLZZ232_1464, partial [Planctomycetota bacterium]